MIKKLYYKLIPSSRKKSMATRFTRSTFGNICCFVLITAAGLFSMLPLIYAVVTSFKPIDELLIFPPTFFVRRPTTENYVALPTLLSSLSVPLSRYVFNSLFITVFTSILNIVFSAMAAFSLSKGTYKGRGIIFMIIQFALMFNAYTLSAVCNIFGAAYSKYLLGIYSAAACGNTRSFPYKAVYRGLCARCSA